MGERDFFFFYDIFALFAEELCNWNYNLLSTMQWNNLGTKEFSTVTYAHY